MGFDHLGKVLAFYALIWAVVIFGAGFLLRGCF